MKPLVILCRHGNTFNKGEKVFMVGAREDLPLTEEGSAQAVRVGEALVKSRCRPGQIISGPLKRTLEFAELIRVETRISAPVEIDHRLIEFDYGAWSGLTTEEIVALSGKAALDQWQESSIRPSGVAFLPSQEEARADAEGLLRTLHSVSGCCVVVTSNGRLRELGRMLSSSSSGFHKVKTGHACVLTSDGPGWLVLGWDLAPQQLADLVAGLT